MISDLVIVAEADLSRAWAQTLLAVAARPDLKAFHTVTTITDVTDEDADLRRVADELLAERHLDDIDTVVNTLFPAALAATEPDPVRLGERYLRLLPQLKKLDRRNNKGTYFGRLVGYAGPTGTTVNQLAELVRKLTVETATARPKSARYELAFEQPGAALPIVDPRRDTGAMAFPCLSLLSFQLDHGQVLHAVAHYRSQYLLQRGYGNYLGIAGLMQYVAAATGLRPGRLTVVAGMATADQVNKAQLARVRRALSD